MRPGPPWLSRDSFRCRSMEPGRELPPHPVKEVLMAQPNTSADVKNVVLVHGGFVDGSGWEGVYKALKKEGYNVTIVQNPTNSLADDVAVAKRRLLAQGGPGVLVGQSYRGGVVTPAGNAP